jgi:RNA polymerase sigma factor (sigma-70 family)
MTDSRLAPVLHHLRRLARPEEPADAALLEQYAGGQDAAFGELVRRHGLLVWRVCRRMLPQAADAEDAYQATFLALAKRDGAIRRPESLAGWLHATAFRIARRLRQDISRRTLAEAEVLQTPTVDPANESA